VPLSVKYTIVRSVYKRHLRLIRELNDLHIFVSRAVPLLETAARDSKGQKIDPDEDMALRVPGKTAKPAVAHRSATELSDLLKRYAHEMLYENLLVTAVSRFEAHLLEVLREFLVRAPEKLLRGPRGGDAGKSVALQAVVEAESLEDLYAGLIDQRLQTIFYAKPAEYLLYFRQITEIEVDQDIFAQFVEIKATRDLIVHNRLIVNELYVEKAGSKARGGLGEVLKVRQHYFESSLSCMKSLAASIERETRQNFGRADEKV
jgi:hypothetical protein